MSSSVLTVAIASKLPLKLCSSLKLSKVQPLPAGEFKMLQSLNGSLDAVGTVDTEDDVVFDQCDAFIAQL